MPRGGWRNGAQGKSYSNRSDLNGAPSMPNVASGQTYGKRQEQQAAQRALPVGPPPPSAASAPPAPPSGGGGLAALLGGGGAPVALPGQVTRLDAPTERLGEPVTAGVPMGAGPGPEVLGALSGEEPEDDYSDVMPYLPILEFMASQPGASPQTRNFVRRIRASKPVV